MSPFVVVRRFFVLAAIAVPVAFGLAAREPVAAQSAPDVPLTVETGSGRHTFRVEVVATAKDRARGLMYRKSVPQGTGMLFDFRRQQPVSFWMKNTYVPLDMIFIRDNGAVARIAHDTTPLSEAPVPSGVPVRYVLEVVAGTAKRIDLAPGDRVSGAGIGD